MKTPLSRLFFLAALLLFETIAVSLSGAEPKIFKAQPGTDTLFQIRDAVRSWRAAGHTNETVVVRLGKGDYDLTQPLTLDARDGNVSWRAATPAKTVISGGRRMEGFEADAAGIWHLLTPLTFEQFFANQQRATWRRFPGEGLFNFTAVRQEPLPNDRVRFIASVPKAVSSSLSVPGAPLQKVQILVAHKWDTSRYFLDSCDPAQNTLTVIGNKMGAWNTWDKNSRFALENLSSVGLLPGNWFLDASGDLSYRPRAGEKLEEGLFIAPVLEKLLKISGAANLHFEGLRFEYTGYRLPPAGCPPGQAAASIGASLEIDDSQNVSFENITIAHTGNYGIWFRRGCQDCRISHSLLEDLGAGGIRIGETAIREQPAQQTGGVIVDNNVIRGGGRVHPSAVGVWIGQSANNRVTHNDIADLYYTGISVGWTWGYGRSLATNNFIGFNRIHQIGQEFLSDLGGFYSLGVSPGSACVGNAIFDVRAHDYGGWGIYPDEGSTGWRIESNVVWNCTCLAPDSGSAFHQHYGATNYLARNLFGLGSGAPLQATRVEKHLSFIFEHNLVVCSNTPVLKGPWDKIQFESRDNRFVCLDPVARPFPNGTLADWQAAGHEPGSVLTTNLSEPARGPAPAYPWEIPDFKAGFDWSMPATAGVYGERAWKHLANESGK